MSWFVLAMAMYPEVQKKAQMLIDQVVGSERLPQVEDKDSLPYIVAIMKEVLRWHNIVQLGERHPPPRMIGRLRISASCA